MNDFENDELADSIFGLVVNLCKNTEQRYPQEEARKRVAEWLEQIASSLRSLNQGEPKQ